ncbi:MAG: TrmB family transcriptional regulator [Halapricum sp.]
MNESELETALEEAGFSPYQSRAYVALLKQGTATVTDIAEMSGVPDSRIYDVLRSLESDGYIEIFEQDTLRARIHDYGKLQDSLRDRAERFATAEDEIKRRWEKPSLEETVVNVVTRFETVLESAADAIETAEMKVELAASPDQYRQLRPALETASENGVNVYLSVFTENAASLPDAEDVASICTEARHRRLQSPFVMIVDRTKVHFAPHAGSTNEYGLIVTDRTHAYVFHWFFLTSQWAIWDPFYTQMRDGLEPDYLDIRYLVRDVTPLLNIGRTIRVRVQGADTSTGEHRTVEGTVREVVVQHDINENTPASLVTYGGRVAIRLETGDGIVEIGGWGALVEDIEAHRLRVLSVE